MCVVKDVTIVKWYCTSSLLVGSMVIVFCFVFSVVDFFLPLSVFVLVYRVLTVSLDCPCLIARSVFSNVYCVILVQKIISNFNHRFRNSMVARMYLRASEWFLFNYLFNYIMTRKKLFFVEMMMLSALY